MSAVSYRGVLTRAPHLQRRIVLFSHWGVLRALTGKEFENCESWECGEEELLADVRADDNADEE